MTGANTSDTNGYVGGDVNIVFDRPTTVEEAKSGVLGDIVNISEHIQIKLTEILI